VAEGDDFLLELAALQRLRDPQEELVVAEPVW